MSAEPHAHHASLRTYLLVWAALIVLTLSTVGLTYLDLGEWHTPVGLAIAVTKAVLIVLIFMHALEGGRLVWIVLSAMVLFLGIMYAFTWADFATRGLDNAVRDPKPTSTARPQVR